MARRWPRLPGGQAITSLLAAVSGLVLEQRMEHQMSRRINRSPETCRTGLCSVRQHLPEQRIHHGRESGYVNVLSSAWKPLQRPQDASDAIPGPGADFLTQLRQTWIR